MNPRQQMSNSGPCPDSHTHPPFPGPLFLLLPTRHPCLDFMDGSQPPLTLCDPRFLCLSWTAGGLSPLTPRRLQHARACVCVRVCARAWLEGVGVLASVWGQEAWPSCGARVSPEQVCRSAGVWGLVPSLSSRVCVCRDKGSARGTERSRGGPGHQLFLASPHPISSHFAGRGGSAR